jgi:hypothetical protein
LQSSTDRKGFTLTPPTTHHHGKNRSKKYAARKHNKTNVKWKIHLHFSRSLWI